MTPFNSLSNNKKLFAIIFYSALAICCYLFFSPPAVTIDVAHSDKYAHIIVFFGLSLLLYKFATINLKLQMGLLTGFGILVELVQSFIPYRSGSVDDIVADMLGILLFYGLVRPLINLKFNND